MKAMTLAKFHAALKAQGVPSHLDSAFICPMCHVVQSARDLISAGAGKTMDDVERFVGFSCVGRFLDAPGPRRQPDGKPCNWTLGGFFQLHDLEVITEDGKRHPRFALATPEQAQAHATIMARK